jgi:SPP1 gp7 family putative phage head morphogenesis protein
MAKRLRRAPVVHGPRQIERTYRAQLVRAVKDIEREISAVLVAALPDLFRLRDALAPRADSWDLEVERMIRGLTVFGTRRVADIIGNLPKYADDVSGFNRRAFASAMASVIGVDITRGIDGQWLAIEMRSWVAENTRLIQSIPERLLTDVDGIVQRALRTGADPRETAREIQQRFGVTESRARLIARDQVSKLNASITQSRNQALGIEFYEWSTSNDERVRGDPGGRYSDARPRHDVMNGKLCRWDDPTVYSEDGGQTWLPRSQIGGEDEHPGMAIQCRCVSRPILPPEFEAAARG